MDMHNKMSGELEPGLLMDMLQLMSRRKNLNGVVEITSGSTVGHIWLAQGMMIAAEWRGRQGEPAVETILSLTQGAFTVQETAEFPPKTIERDSVAVLMSCMRAIGKAQLTPPVAATPAAFEMPKQRPVAAKVVPKPAPTPAPTVAVAPPPAKAVSLMALVQSAGADSVPEVKAPLKRHVPARVWGQRAAVSAAAAAVVLVSLVLVPRLVTARAEKAAAPEVPPVVATPTPAPRVLVSVPVQGSSGDGEMAGWPVMNLSALVACDRTGGCAILNGQLVAVGGEVNGIRLRAIRSGGVTLEYQGKCRTIAMERRMAF